MRAMYVTLSGSTATSYPLYDSYGNMISTLSKQGTGGYSYTALRTFDAWGVIRRGAQTGDPKGRYCASLGHKQDDESGLVYMRARYYEPSVGRFIGADPSSQGRNWFVYCTGDPCNRIDQTGKSWETCADFFAEQAYGVLFAGGFLAGLAEWNDECCAGKGLSWARIGAKTVEGLIIAHSNESGHSFQ
jgi:RHS repeat-associated protein